MFSMSSFEHRASGEVKHPRMVPAETSRVNLKSEIGRFGLPVMVGGAVLD